MTRYADPERCPDCQGPIAVGTTACPRCGLPLRGDTAQLLFTALQRADGLLESLRSEATPVTPAEPSLTAGLAAHTPTTMPGGTRPPPRLTASSVPKILLSL